MRDLRFLECFNFDLNGTPVFARINLLEVKNAFAIEGIIESLMELAHWKLCIHITFEAYPEFNLLLISVLNKDFQKHGCFSLALEPVSNNEWLLN